MLLNRSAFTFVELIVVIIIITILATIGFTAYESYLGTGRDTKRIVQLKELQTAFQEYSFRERLPLPDASIQLQTSGTTYAYQGYLSEDILKQLSFKANVYDDITESFPIYLLGMNQKDFQFLTFLEDPASTAFSQYQVFASVDYRTLFPKTLGKPLGVLLEQQTNIPLHVISSVKSVGYYDIVSGTGLVSAYLSEHKILESDQDDFIQLLPQNSCKRIMELGYSKGSGEYTLSVNGNTKIKVYCEMEIDGGGWTILVNNDNSDDEFISDTSNICYPRLSGDVSHSCGSIEEKSDFVVNANGINFTELVWGVYEGKFNNLKTYRLLQWNSLQKITSNIPLQIPVADEDRNLLLGFKNLNLIYCGPNLANARYIETGAPNNSFPHNPVTTIGLSSYDTGKISFTDARVNGTDSNSFGFDDFQDGQSCGDNYSDKNYKGYSSYIMVR